MNEKYMLSLTNSEHFITGATVHLQRFYLELLNKDMFLLLPFSHLRWKLNQLHSELKKRNNVVLYFITASALFIRNSFLRLSETSISSPISPCARFS